MCHQCPVCFLLRDALVLFVATIHVLPLQPARKIRGLHLFDRLYTEWATRDAMFVKLVRKKTWTSVLIDQPTEAYEAKDDDAATSLQKIEQIQKEASLWMCQQQK